MEGKKGRPPKYGEKTKRITVTVPGSLSTWIDELAASIQEELSCATEGEHQVKVPRSLVVASALRVARDKHTALLREEIARAAGLPAPLPVKSQEERNRYLERYSFTGRSKAYHEKVRDVLASNQRKMFLRLLADRLSKEDREALETDVTARYWHEAIAVAAYYHCASRHLFSCQPLDGVDKGDALYLDYVYSPAAELGECPTVDLVVREVAMKATPHFLKVKFDTVSVDSLINLHGLDGVAEVIDAAGTHIALERDRYHLQKLLANLHVKEYRVLGRNTCEYLYNREAYLRFRAVVLEQSANIHKKTLRRPADWIVVPPEYEQMIRRHAKKFEETSELGAGIAVTEVGAMEGKWRVFVDPFLEPSLFLIGASGVTYMDTGYIWSPYALVFPGDTDGTIEVLEGAKCVRPEYYVAIRHSPTGEEVSPSTLAAWPS